MEHVTPLLLLSVAAWAGCEPLRQAIHQRSESFGTYANRYSQNYEPYMYAAVPLHPPLPVVHILSPTPITSITHELDHRHSSSVQRPTYQEIPRTSSKTYWEQDYEEPFGKSQSHRPISDTYPTRPSHAVSTFRYNMYKDSDFAPSYHPSSVPQMYVKPTYPTSVQYTFPTPEASAAILYASPNVDGGYTYNKRPKQKRTTPKPAPTPALAPTKSPVILRVHKYKVVKDYKR